MTRVLHDHLPTEMTAGEMCAIGDSCRKGWIAPPVQDTLEGEQPRAWRSVHVRYLERRGLIREWRYRRDGIFRVRLNQVGLELRDRIVERFSRTELYAAAGVVLP